ncbi:MAG: cell division protein FtsK [Cyanobacteria bacterium CRU_2_1]|nr:cell division protein FtsK [Cyanobacteria bacterium CRU_2_1]
MKYLTQTIDIQKQITEFSLLKRLWLDTEVADWHTSRPRLSLIQVLTHSTDCIGESAYVLDVLDKPELVGIFIDQIMANPNIEKVFHNADYDLNFLGKAQAQNVICTLKMARKIGVKTLGVTNLKLKTLAAELCHFSNVDSEEQGSDWGRRSLSPKQLNYATMDVVYLAAVHRRLLEHTHPDADKESNMVSKHLRQTAKRSESLSFTATKVRVALECPRLFYLNHTFGDKPLFIPSDSSFSIGNPFHQLADRLVHLLIHDSDLQTLFNPPAEQLQIETITAQIQQRFFELEFSPYLQDAIKNDDRQAPALLQVWQGLQGLIKRFSELLITNRYFCNAESLVSHTFFTGKRRLEHHFTLPDGTLQRVAGELDCLICDLEHRRLSVVEFKTYQPVDPSAQLAQVALYSYILWTKKNVPIDSTIYCVLPEFKEYQYSWEQLENTIHQRIPYKLQQMRQWADWQQGQPDPPPATTQPYLCEICPQKAKCQAFFTTANEAQIAIESFAISDSSQVEQQEPPVSQSNVESEEQEHPSPTADADAIGENLVQTLASFGIGATYHGAAIAPSFIRVKLKPNPGVKVNAILRLSNDLRVQLGLTYPPLIAPQAGFVSVDLPRPDRQTAAFDRYIQPQSSTPSDPVRIAIGVDLEGQLVEADLADPNSCHFLVGGTTGSGKSEFLRSLLLSLLVRHTPDHLKIALVDPKRVTFPEFEQMPWLYQPVVKESERAIELMHNLVSEMDKRYQQFEKAGCANLTDYNKRPQPMPRIVCIFDEYADFMAEKETAKALEFSIKRLGAMARAAGIHLIIATQRPEARVVTPLIRSNLPGRVALRTASEADSTIVLGGKQIEAAYLLGKGDLLYLAGANLLRLQSLFAPSVQLPQTTVKKSDR